MGKDINGKAYKGGFEGVMMKPVVNVVEEEEE
jgi:hypothetical protein